jgi:hypothetical protein
MQNTKKELVPKTVGVSLTNCPGCLSRLVDRNCPTCGFVSPQTACIDKSDHGPNQISPSKEQTLLTVRPDFYKNHPIALFSFLVIALFSSTLAYRAGLDFAILWCIPIFSSFVLIGLLLEPFTTQLTVTNKRTILQQGILSNRTREVRDSDVRMLEVNQSFLQRILEVGSIAVASAGVEGLEIAINGIVHPQLIKETIDGCRA